MRQRRTRIAVAAVALCVAFAGGLIVDLSANSMSEQGDRIAYVAREASAIDGGDSFHAYVASDSSESAVVVMEGPGWTSLDEALRWSRRQADRVVLSYGVSGEGVFSAGSVYYSGEDESSALPQWPPPAPVIHELDAQARKAARAIGSGGATLGVEEPEER